MLTLHAGGRKETEVQAVVGRQSVLGTQMKGSCKGSGTLHSFTRFIELCQVCQVIYQLVYLVVQLVFTVSSIVFYGDFTKTVESEVFTHGSLSCILPGNKTEVEQRCGECPFIIQFVRCSQIDSHTETCGTEIVTFGGYNETFGRHIKFSVLGGDSPFVLRSEDVQFINMYGCLCQSHEGFHFGAHCQAFIDFARMAEGDLRIVGRYDI